MGLAKNAKSSDDFIDQIKATETIDINDKVSTFATELYNKIPRGSTSGQKRKLENRMKEKAALELQAKNKSFKTLEEDSGDEEAPKVKKKKAKAKSKKAKSESESDDEFDRMERDRQRDQEDMKAFSKRLLEKDKEKRRNVMEKSDKKGYEEAAKRLAMGKSNCVLSSSKSAFWNVFGIFVFSRLSGYDWNCWNYFEALKLVWNVF